MERRRLLRNKCPLSSTAVAIGNVVAVLQPRKRRPFEAQGIQDRRAPKCKTAPALALASRTEARPLHYCLAPVGVGGGRSSISVGTPMERAPFFPTTPPRETATSAQTPHAPRLSP